MTFGPARYVDHIGIVVRDLDAALGLYTRLFSLPEARVIEEHELGLRVALVHVGEAMLEFLQPMHDNTGVSDFLRTRGEGLHHLALHVDNVAQKLEEFRREGIRLVDEVPRPGPAGLIAFAHPKSFHGVLMELVQTPPP